MHYMNVKRVKYNIIINIASTALSFCLGIIIPRLFLVSLGSEANGLVSSIGQIYAYVGLMEAGIGATVIQALYSPISRGDKEEINGILAASSRYYKKIGAWYIICIIAIALVYPKVIDTTIPTAQVVVVVLLSGLGNAINFLLQQNYIVLLMAEGKGYIVTIFNMAVNIASSLLKIVLLISGANVAQVIAGQFIISCFRILILRIYMRSQYKWLNLRVPPIQKALSKQRYVMVLQLSYFVYSNTDILILTFLCDLKTVSVYTIYVMIVGMLEAILSTVTNSVTFYFGQLYARDKVNFKRYFTIFDAVYMTALFALFTVMYLFITPFLSLYTAGVADANYVDQPLAMLFCLMKMVGALRSQASNSVNFAGLFKETQKSSVVEATMNLVISLIAVKAIGIHGVVVGSIVSTLYKDIVVVSIANKAVMGYSAKEGRNKWIRWGIDLACFFVLAFLLNGKVPMFGDYFSMAMAAVFATAVMMILYFSVLFIRERNLARECWALLRKIRKDNT